MKQQSRAVCASLILLTLAGAGLGSAPAASYYVATNGVDTNAGTNLAAPFLTIQKAANVMVAGDNCYIRVGTYREAVTPANSGTVGSPITYQNYANEVAVINGAEIITGWTLDSGITYKAALANNFFVSPYNQSEQVFVDGTNMTLAKWPNTTTSIKAYPSGTAPAVDISHPAKSVITSFISKTDYSSLTVGVVADTALPAKPAGFYEGAQIFFQPNNGAWSWVFTGVVTNVTGSQLTFTTVNGSGKDGSGTVYDPASRYYLFNKKEFLDAPGEWWQDVTNGQLYVIMPDSGSPVGHTVEVKKREFVFNLSNKSYITVKGLNLFACTITTDTGAGGTGQPVVPPYTWRGAGSVAAANHIVMDGINAQYLSHFTDVSGHFYMQWGQGSGIILSGSDCILQNSILQYSAGNGVSVLGQRNKVLNNFIYDTAYAGDDCSAINGGGAATTVDHEIATNTIVRTGRSGITPRSLQNSNAGGGQFLARIHHNDASQFMIQDWDGGAVYGAGNGLFTRIDHNRFHDSSGYTCSGIYFDFSKNFVIDHNVVWNVEWGIHLQNEDTGTQMANHLVYNNTVGVKNTSGATYGPFGFGNSGGISTNTVIANNIVWLITPPGAPGYAGIPASSFGGATITTNLAWDGVANSATDPKFAGASTNNYQLLSGSPARGTGMVIPSYTRDGITVPAFADNPTGTHDIGAYEYFNNLLIQSATPTVAPGNPSAPIIPGATVQEQIILNNQTIVSLTNLTATISTTNAGVTIVSNTSAFRVMVIGALGTNLTTFSYLLATNMTAGTVLNFTLVATSNGQSYTNTFSHTVSPANGLLLQAENFTIYQGNTNSSIDPGETVQEKIILNNQTFLAFTNLAASISTTNAGIVSITSASVYPVMPVGALGTNLTLFAYRLATNVPAGTVLNFSVVASGNGQFYTNTFSHAVGPPSLNLFTNTVFSANVPKAIPDLGLIYSTNNITGLSGTIDKVVVGVRIDHTYDSDLIIAVQHPDGSPEVILASRVGSSGQNFGSTVGSTINYTVFDDAATNTLAYPFVPPYVGSVRPNAALTNFIGKAPNGLWRLHVSDNAGGDTGTLLAWYLTITSHTTGNANVIYYPPPAANAQIFSTGNQNLAVNYFGLPGAKYAVLAATNLNGPWLPVATNTADINGQWIFSDNNATNAQCFYRALQN
ncbi:MAG: proprotein convertase P-domain-containing protein [Verrucomicrobiota bacterium]